MPDLNDLKPLLIKSSKIMDEYSANCFTDFAAFNSSNNTPESSCCDWYHAAWQYLRVLDCVSAPQWHNEFYVMSFKNLIENSKENLNILLSGTADYSLLHILLCVLLDTNKTATIDIVDLCRTPLKICSWYIDNCNNIIFRKPHFEITVNKNGNSRLINSKTINGLIHINFVNCNISFYNVEDKEHQYDLICTDAFLTRFAQKEVQSITDKWSYLLKRNGKVITTVRINCKAGDERKIIRDNITTKSINISLFCTKVIKAFNDLTPQERGELGINAEDLRFMAFRYIERMKSNNLGDKDDIKVLFSNSGLKIIDQESFIENVKGEIAPTDYYRIVAKKA